MSDQALSATRPRLLSLDRPYPSRYGTPVIRQVEPSIFERRYFTHCMQCGFCHDQCCSYGVDVDLHHHARILEHADDLEAFTGLARGRWFRRQVTPDRSMPGGGSVRTRVRGGRCVFVTPGGRGCRIHAFCLARGIDYHELKSMVDCLFPITFEADVLWAAEEVHDGTLVCLDQGPSLYRGLREEVRYYFGEALVEVLDGLEGTIDGRGE